MINLGSLVRQKGIEVRLTELQQLAFNLVIVFVAVILVALIGAAVAAYLFFPAAPTFTPPPNATADQIPAYNTQLLDRFKQYQDLQAARFATMGTTLVSTIFLPSLTLVLGYLFGKQQ